MSSSVGDVVQHVRSRCPCSGVWLLKDRTLFSCWCFFLLFFNAYSQRSRGRLPVMLVLGLGLGLGLVAQVLGLGLGLESGPWP